MIKKPPQSACQTVTVFATETHSTEYEGDISSIEINGRRLSDNLELTTQVRRLVWAFGSLAVCGLIIAIGVGAYICALQNQLHERFDQETRKILGGVRQSNGLLKDHMNEHLGATGTTQILDTLLPIHESEAPFEHRVVRFKDGKPTSIYHKGVTDTPEPR